MMLATALPTPTEVIPAKAGTQLDTCAGFTVGPCFRRDDTLVEG